MKGYIGRAMADAEEARGLIRNHQKAQPDEAKYNADRRAG